MESRLNIAGVLLQVAIITGQLLQVGTDPGPRPEILKPAPVDASPKLVLPCRVLRVVDGDTVDVVIPIRARVRLLDCWAPEVRGANLIEKRRGLASADYLHALAHDKPGVLTVPLGDGNGLSDLFSFGRILGRVQVDGRDLATEQVRAGHATKNKK